MRTSVAPSAIATSKSFDMPIDNSRTWEKPASWVSSLNFLNNSKCGRLSSASRPRGGMHIKPTTRKASSADASRTSVIESAGRNSTLLGFFPGIDLDKHVQGFYPRAIHALVQLPREG